MQIKLTIIIREGLWENNIRIKKMISSKHGVNNGFYRPSKYSKNTMEISGFRKLKNECISSVPGHA